MVSCSYQSVLVIFLFFSFYLPHFLFFFSWFCFLLLAEMSLMQECAPCIKPRNWAAGIRKGPWMKREEPYPGSEEGDTLGLISAPSLRGFDWLQENEW